ncbi:MAG: NAD(P)-binding protein [Ignavibacteriae bacterium]|nr:NAD(P)-binding protein [Ignavibacteriota bacterium]
MRRLVKIAGAGLSGLTAALVLARHGYQVEVRERKSRLLPSSGPHTEGIRNYKTIDALDELAEVGFDIRPFSTINTTIRRSPRFMNVLRGPAHYLFMRGTDEQTVDQVLFHRTKELGVHFRFGVESDPMDCDIIATGPPKDGFNILGAGYTFSAEGGHLDMHTAHALFDNEVAPAGYLVVTPGLRFHSIYSVSWKDFQYERLLARTESALQIPWIRQILGRSRWTGKILGRAYFARDPISHAVRGDALVVGEAAGFQDAVAGFGFRHAVLSGALAALAIIGGKDYRELLRAAFGNEFEQAYRFRQWLDSATNDDYDSMINSLGLEIALREYIQRRGPRAL